MMTTSNWWDGRGGPVGITWLARLANRFPRSAWLNPEPMDIWDAPTISEIRTIFDMFPLTLEGLDEMVHALRRPPTSARRARVHALAHMQRPPA
jgi:hypothetical protein